MPFARTFLVSIFVIAFHFFGANELLAQKDSSFFHYEHELLFEGKSTFIDANYRYVMEYLIEILAKNPNWTLHIRGHVCCGPNERISAKRAKRVYKFLRKNGIEESRMTYKGYSDSLPAVFPEKTKEDEVRNRRVDFLIFTH